MNQSAVYTSELIRNLGKWCLERGVSSRELIIRVLRNNYYIDQPSAERLASSILKAMDAGSFGLERSHPVHLQHSKRGGFCAKCGAATQAGEPIFWDPEYGTVWHETCETNYTRRDLSVCKVQAQLATMKTVHVGNRVSGPKTHGYTDRELMSHYDVKFATDVGSWDRTLAKYGTKKWYGKK
jgi:hypothetical protein